MIPRRVSTRPTDDTEWGCHKCKAKNGLEVVRTEHGEDWEPVRIRKCKNCDEPFATREEVIPLDQFYALAESHRIRSYKRWAKNYVPCRICAPHHNIPSEMSDRAKARHPAFYKAGRFSQHVRKATHLEVLRTQPTDRSRALERTRRNREYWKKRGIDIDTASASRALQEIDSDSYRNPNRNISRVEDFRHDRNV